MRTLAGRPFDRRRFTASGTVLLNLGQFCRSTAWHRKVGFVQRSDELYPKLTVEETVLFAVRLKLVVPEGQTRRVSHAHRVAQLLKTWSLEHIAERRVCDIDSEMLSVGNRKRVAIAVHTAHRPDVLLLDEPTLGLDPKRAEQLIRDLHNYAVNENTIVIISINPARGAIFRYFSNILLLCHGQTVFFGPVQDALWYFEKICEMPYAAHQNPSDYLIDCVTIDLDDPEHHPVLDALRARLRDKWLQHRHLFIRNTVAVPSTSSASVEPVEWPNSWTAEMQWLLRRELIEQVRDYPPMAYNVLQRLLVFTLLSFLYFQVDETLVQQGVRMRFGLLIFLPVNQASLVLAMIVPTMTFVRPVIVRERLAFTFRVSSIYVARVLAEFPVNFLTTIIYAFIIYYVTGLRAGFIHFVIFLAILLLQVYAILGIGIFVSCCARNRPIRDILTIVIFLTMFMFGGYQVQNRLDLTWILRWIQFLSPIFYSYIAFILNEFQDNVIDGVEGNAILEDYGAIIVSIWAALGALFGLGTLFFACGYVALRITTRPGRFIFDNMNDRERRVDQLQGTDMSSSGTCDWANTGRS